MLNNKYGKLKNFIAGQKSAVVAFSGGVDSAVLAKLAVMVLGKKAVAVTAVSPTYLADDLRDAKRLAKEIGIQHLIVATNEFTNKNFFTNPQNRCYWCKRELFTQLKQIAIKHRLAVVMDGANYSDRDDVRPGLRANKEFGIVSPFVICKFSKANIRALAKQWKLSVWNKPAQACLSSRIPFGKTITLEKIKKVEAAERVLKSLIGKPALIRCRDHDDLLRIEIQKEFWTKLYKSDINKLIKKFKNIGYKYITFDLEGYVLAGKR